MKKILAAALTLLLLAGCVTANVNNDIQTMQDDTRAILEETRDLAEETLKIEESVPETEEVIPGSEMIPATTEFPDVPPALYLLTDEEKSAYFDFTLQLFRDCVDPEKEENVMISPLSVMTALGMTANGAKNTTLTQMEDALGMKLDTLNAMLGAYLPSLPAAEKYKLTPANSIWYRDSDALHVEDAFLSTNQKFYSAEIRAGAFDSATCDAINAWVKENTDGMITKLLDEIPSDAMLYLINALAFVSEWENGYEADDVRDGTFTSVSGVEQTVPMMHSSESRYLYLSQQDVYGFYKEYVDGKYAFAAILPPDDMTLDAYIASMDAESLSHMLANLWGNEVIAALPKFTAEYGNELSPILSEMGMTDLFDSTSCDLSGMAQSSNGNLYVSRVLHKTFISVDEVGTKAAAVTAAEVVAESISEPIEITLDRPFVYMIVDTTNDIPIFIGTVETLGA